MRIFEIKFGNVDSQGDSKIFTRNLTDGKWENSAEPISIVQSMTDNGYRGPAHVIEIESNGEQYYPVGLVWSGKKNW